MSHHVPVLLHEILELLQPRPGGKYIDATFGGGGHTKAILEVLGKQGRVLAIDANPSAVKDAPHDERLTLVQENFRAISTIASRLSISGVDGILFDLGLSSDLLVDPLRGFSFQTEGPLDMRLDQGQHLNAFEIVNGWAEPRLAQVFETFGEERFARRIAKTIVNSRRTNPVRSTIELAAAVRAAVPGKFRKKSQDVVRRIFQALRIAVNDELDSLERALPDAFELLATGGRMVVISFHSLEDRIVKHYFQTLARGCVCPPEFPECRCGKSPQGRILTRKPITATPAEQTENPRAASAKLRAIEKVT